MTTSWVCNIPFFSCKNFAKRIALSCRAILVFDLVCIVVRKSPSASGCLQDSTKSELDYLEDSEPYQLQKLLAKDLQHNLQCTYKTLKDLNKECKSDCSPGEEIGFDCLPKFLIRQCCGRIPDLAPNSWKFFGSSRSAVSSATPTPTNVRKKVLQVFFTGNRTSILWHAKAGKSKNCNETEMQWVCADSPCVLSYCSLLQK